MSVSISAKVLAGIALMGASLAVQAETTLIFNNFLPPSHFIRDVTAQWAADVERETQGRVKLEIPAGSLAAPPQQVNAVKSGIADLAITANVFVQKQAPLLSYSSLPFLINDAEAASVANWRTYSKFLADSAPLKRHGVDILSVFNFSGGHLYGLAEEPIETMEQLGSKRLWALPGYTAGTIKNLGLSPVTGPAVKVSETVAKGVVDAFYGISYESVTDFKAAPYTKNIVQFPFSGTSTSFSLIINKRAWSKLSDQDRQIITKLSGESFARNVGAAAKQASIEALAAMQADGIKLINAKPEFYAAFKDASQPLFEGFYKQAENSGFDGKAMLADFRAEYAKELGQ
ncbi:MAG: TRAP transporter substrate-binding protein DctP [Amphritea sp.]